MIMTKKLRYFCTLLLMAVASVAWADDVEFYTLDTSEKQGTGQQNSYGASYDIEYDGITWNFNGNIQMNPWRLGGKKITGVDRTVYTKTAMGAAITKLDLTLSTGGDITLNSLKLTVASDASFSTVLDEVTLNGSNVNLDGTVNTVTPTPGKTWAMNAYYKFTFNVTVSLDKNKYIGFDKVEFYKEKEAGEKVDPTVEISAESINVGETAQVTTNGPAVSLSTDDETVSIDGTTITGVSAGTATITATWEENDQYNGGEQEFNITIVDPNVKGGANNPYTVAEAIEYINTLEPNTLSTDDVYVSGVVSQIDSYVGDRYITYWISDDGTTDNQMEVFKGLGLDGAFFSAKTDLTVGDKVTVCGKVKLYKNNSGTTIIPEFDTGSIIVSLEENTDPYIEAEDVELAYDATEGEIAYTINNEPSTGFNLTVSSDSEWLTARPGADVISLSCTENTGYDARTATVTIKITYDSKVVTKDVTVTQDGAPAIFDNIADMFESATSFGNKATDVLVKFGGWVVTGASSTNVFVSDGTHGFIIYAKNHGFKVDDVLTSEEAISCKLQLYNGSAEITALTAETDGLTVTTNEGDDTYATVPMAELSGVNTGALVSYEGLECSVENSKYYLSDGTTTLQVYNTLYDFGTLEAGKQYNITGVYQQFRDTKEILPRSAADIEEIPTSVTVEIGETGYATLYYDKLNLEIPEGVTVSTVNDVVGTKLEEEPVEDVIPAGLGVILKGTPSTSYTFNVVSGTYELPGSMLGGFDKDTMINGDPETYYYYKFSTKDGKVGFWWGEENGGEFMCEAHKVYMAIDKSHFKGISGAKNFISFAGEDNGVTTGINNVDKIAEDAAIYNLNGVRVNKVQKGVYVVNGKKVVIK